ncbi:hypothetical protein FOE78_01855 [Microlunatus elymi]|uniref:Mannosyltransferase (PIG-V) n=1 Tax=Microlunatus elymi TaxID=2596828 RepID=A0A516PUJ7_9ACTN|nr:mannosyltransferase family protein [Microlunatus elymi]QDP94829.1 hypothetical protein FOE78_01855 [Microlunatus elymi]
MNSPATEVAELDRATATEPPGRGGVIGRWWRRPGGLSLHSFDPRGGRITIQAWLASRGLIALVALLLAVVTHRDLMAMVNNWDAVHFADLARHGYGYDPDGKLMAFFPGLPLMLRAGLLFGVPTQISGMIIAGIGSAFAAAALYRLGGPWAAVVWLFAPTAVFTTVGYTEAAFCAFAFWAWERARSDRWLAAALLAGCACTVRVSGLFLVGALFIMIITTRKINWATRLRRAGLLLIPVAVLAAYATYLHGLSGSWTAWYDAQVAGWYRGFTWPWQSFQNTWAAVQPGAYADHPYWAWVFRAEMVSMAVGVLVTIWCLTQKLWAEASWVAVQVLAFSLSYWYMSVNRAVLLWFPLMIMIARFGQWRPASRPAAVAHRVVVIIGSALGTAAMITWSWLFFSGYWAS